MNRKVSEQFIKKVITKYGLPPYENEAIQFNKPLSVNTLYYIWIKDADGNTSYQTFTIFKPVIQR